MDAEPHRESAKIYAFLTRDRLRSARQGTRVASPKATLPQAQPTEFGSGWYHDEAIAEARRDGKR
jgi:hypothetical protein